MNNETHNTRLLILVTILFVVLILAVANVWGYMPENHDDAYSGTYAGVIQSESHNDIKFCIYSVPVGEPTPRYVMYTIEKSNPCPVWISIPEGELQ